MNQGKYVNLLWYKVVKLPNKLMRAKTRYISLKNIKKGNEVKLREVEQQEANGSLVKNIKIIRDPGTLEISACICLN